MLWPAHMTIAATSFATTAVFANEIGVTTTTPGEMICGTLVASGVGLWCDIDSHSSSVSSCLGPVSKSANKIITPLAGGHRKGTHSLLALALVTAVAQFAVTLPSPWLAIAMFFVSLCTVFRQLMSIPDAGSAALAALVSVGLYSFSPDLSWISWAVFIGYGTHMLCDFFTKQGIALFWPLFKAEITVADLSLRGPLRMIAANKRSKYAPLARKLLQLIPRLALSTGGRVERALTYASAGVCLWALWSAAFWPALQTRVSPHPAEVQLTQPQAQTPPPSRVVRQVAHCQLRKVHIGGEACPPTRSRTQPRPAAAARS